MRKFILVLFPSDYTLCMFQIILCVLVTIIVFSSMLKYVIVVDLPYHTR